MAAAAYRCGLRLADERIGTVADYTPRRGVLRDQALLVLPPGAPTWDREQLWNAVEAAETRKNSTVAREVEMSLPMELEQADRVALAHDFGRALSARYGCAVDVQIHVPIHDDDPRNFHTHILMSTRALGPDGFGAKTRVLDDQKTGPQEVEWMRKEWAERVNAALDFRGFAERIDHRSNARRGLDAVPTIHEGRGATAASRAERNDEITGLNSQIADLLVERAQMVATATVEAAVRQAEIDVAAAFDAEQRLAMKRAAPRPAEPSTARATPPAAPGPAAAAKSRMTLEELTAHARQKIAARRAAEKVAVAQEISQGAAAGQRRAVAKKLQAARVLEKIDFQRSRAAEKLATAQQSMSLALPHHEVKPAREKLEKSQLELPVAKARLKRYERRRKQLKEAPPLPVWKVAAKVDRSREVREIEEAIKLAREAIEMILDLLRGRTPAGAAVLQAAKQTSVADVRKAMADQEQRLEQLGRRAAAVQRLDVAKPLKALPLPKAVAPAASRLVDAEPLTQRPSGPRPR